MISYGKQLISEEDINAVINVLKSDYLTQGPAVEMFESSLGSYFGAKHCCVVSNGTAALHLASKALNWKKDDIVLTSPITFLATANCIVYSGATPDFVDINHKDYNIDINKLEEKILFYKSIGKKIKAVVGVDFSGQPCNWLDLRYLADKFEFQLINDNCHSMGAEYNDDITYAVKFADLVTQSYHPVKNLTSGEGGSIMTLDTEIDKKVRSLRSHGMIKGNDLKASNNYPWYYEMHEVGYNYRLTDIQSALGISQLSKLDSFVKRRRDISKKYDDYFKNIDFFQIPIQKKFIKHAFHLYPLLIDFEALNKSKNSFFDFMKKMGILLQVHYIPIYSQPFYKKKFGFSSIDFPNSEKFYKAEVSLPIYPGLKDSEQEEVIRCIFEFFNIEK